MSKLPKLIVIFGPTAAGKTDLAVALAKKFNGEIVNADSRTIYRGMDIGTAKPRFQNPPRSPFVKGGGLGCLPLRKGEREGVSGRLTDPSPPPLTKGRRFGYFYKGVRHHLFDLVNPDERFSAAEYKELAIKTICDIISRGKTPFLVGGTGLYIDAVTKNLPLGDAALPNKKLRAQFEKDLKANRARALKKYYQKLLKLDPQIKIDKNNPRRIVRALEICLTGRKFSEQEKEGKSLFKVLKIGVNVPRAELYKRINRRVDKMIKSGLEKEVRWLSKKYSWKSSGMSGIGYREWQNYLKSCRVETHCHASLQSVAENIKKDTRNFAKRQLTWWRRDKSIEWNKNQAKILALTERFLKVDRRHRL